jgi:uncharacterized integral membrane protein
MPWKFILFIAICILFSIFIGFNITYTGTIDFLFAKVENAPIFLVVLFSFFTGTCVGILAALFKRGKKKIKGKKEKKAKEIEQEDQVGENALGEESVPERKRGRKKK